MQRMVNVKQIQNTKENKKSWPNNSSSGFILRNNTKYKHTWRLSYYSHTHKLTLVLTHKTPKARVSVTTCLSLSAPSLSCLSRLWPLLLHASWSAPRPPSASALWCRSCRSHGSVWQSQLKQQRKTQTVRDQLLEEKILSDSNYVLSTRKLKSFPQMHVETRRRSCHLTSHETGWPGVI